MDNLYNSDNFEGFMRYVDDHIVRRESITVFPYNGKAIKKLHSIKCNLYFLLKMIF